jgi:hypothetical protein
VGFRADPAVTATFLTDEHVRRVFRKFVREYSVQHLREARGFIKIRDEYTHLLVRRDCSDDCRNRATNRRVMKPIR